MLMECCKRDGLFFAKFGEEGAQVERDGHHCWYDRVCRREEAEEEGLHLVSLRKQT